MKGIQKGLEIPNISKEQYTELKRYSTDTSFIRSVACFTYSYNGKEWGGYTLTDRTGTYNYVRQRTNYYNKLRQNDTFMKTTFTLQDYKTLNPLGSLIYCDPPYRGTTGYGSNAFDHDEFWDTMRKWSLQEGNTVFISEYQAPSDFHCIGSSKKYSTLSRKSERSIRTEKLFVYTGSPNLKIENGSY
jgi:DNA adenine methylase